MTNNRVPNRVGQNVAKTKTSRIFVQRKVGDVWTDVGTMGWHSKEDAEKFMPNHKTRYPHSEFRYVERTVVVTDKLV